MIFIFFFFVFASIIDSEQQKLCVTETTEKSKTRMVLKPDGNKWSTLQLTCDGKECPMICNTLKTNCVHSCTCVNPSCSNVVTRNLDSVCALEEQRICQSMCYRLFCKDICTRDVSPTTCRTILLF